VSRGRLPAIVLEWTWFASAAMKNSLFGVNGPMEVDALVSVY
jgi:hypothetical protein